MSAYVSLNCDNFFDRYYIHPRADELSPCDRLIATIATAILFVATLGFYHLFKSPTEYKVTDLTNQIEDPYMDIFEALNDEITVGAEYLDYLGVEFTQIPSRGLCDYKDMCLLGLSGELKVLIKAAQESKVKEDLAKIKEWDKQEHAKIQGILKTIPASMRQPTKNLLDALDNLNINESESADTLALLLLLDREHRTTCLKAYLTQPRIEKFFKEGQSLSSRFKQGTEYARLYKLG